jgi:hypothetical protein
VSSAHAFNLTYHGPVQRGFVLLQRSRRQIVDEQRIRHRACAFDAMLGGTQQLAAKARMTEGRRADGKVME